MEGGGPFSKSIHHFVQKNEEAAITTLAHFDSTAVSRRVCVVCIDETV